MNTISDEEIVLRVQSGKKDDFGVLVERYEAKISRYARRFLFEYDDVEDLVQEVFVKAYTNIQSFDTDKRFSPWIYRIAHNEFVNAIKKKSRLPVSFFDPDTLFPHPVAKEDVEKDFERKETTEMLENCLEKLDVKYREVLTLYYFEEMKYGDIAEVLRIPVATVGVRLRRGREYLKKMCYEQN